MENIADPDVMQQYVDYMILDPSQSSVRMQTPLLDPYTYRQVGPGHFKTDDSVISFISAWILYISAHNLKRNNSRKVAFSESQ